jgi:hypothetical protein
VFPGAIKAKKTDFRLDSFLHQADTPHRFGLKRLRRSAGLGRTDSVDEQTMSPAGSFQPGFLLMVMQTKKKKGKGVAAARQSSELKKRPI